MKFRILTRLKDRWRRFRFSYARLSRILRWTGRLVLLLVVMDIGYLVGIWPDWQLYSSGEIPRSRFIQAYELDYRAGSDLPPLRWRPVAISRINTRMLQAALAAEDARFFEHNGIDPEAFQKAMEYNWEKKRIVYGASTISQQTVKNLFLTGSRNPLRKLHELVLTFAMESNLEKKRILEIYLNIAEFGLGIYGVEAASQHYYGISASRLSLDQAIELAATLPAPRNNNPESRTRFFIRQRDKIRRNIGYNSN